MSSKSESSWTPRTNSVLKENDSNSLSNIKITNQNGTKLRGEAVSLDNGLINPLNWRELVWEFEDYIRENEDKLIFLQDENTGDRLAIDEIHRFSESYLKKQYAEIKQLERNWEDRHEDFNVSMITLTGSNRTDSGDYVPPVDHLQQLKDGWSNAYESLYNVMREAEEWDYLKLLEPHKSGYPHMHIAVFHTNDLTVSDFEPVVNSHLNTCELAGEEAHQLISMEEQQKRKYKARDGQYPDLGCVTTKEHDPSQGGAGTYVASYISKELNREGTVLEASDSLKRFYALMWATNSKRFTKSQSSKEKIEEQHIQEADTPEKLDFEQLGKRLDEDFDLDDPTGRFRAQQYIKRQSDVELSEFEEEYVGRLQSRLARDWSLYGVARKTDIGWSEGQTADSVDDEDILKCGEGGGGGVYTLEVRQQHEVPEGL